MEQDPIEKLKMESFDVGYNTGHAEGRRLERCHNFARMMKLKRARKRREKKIWNTAVDKVLSLASYIRSENVSILIGETKGEAILGVDEYWEEIMKCETSLKRAFCEMIRGQVIDWGHEEETLAAHDKKIQDNTVDRIIRTIALNYYSSGAKVLPIIKEVETLKSKGEA